jgi:hypothetical protein
MEKQVVELHARADQIERCSSEQRLAEERKHSEEIQFHKRTNQQLKVIPSIKKFILHSLQCLNTTSWFGIYCCPLPLKHKKIKNYNSTRFIWVWNLVFQCRGAITLRLFMNMLYGPNTAKSTKGIKWHCGGHRGLTHPRNQDSLLPTCYLVINTGTESQVKWRVENFSQCV